MVLKIKRGEPDLTDPDNPEWTDEDFARAQGPEALSDIELAAFPKSKGGRPKAENPKVPVSIRLSQETLDKWKAAGPGWQTRIDNALYRGDLSPVVADLMRGQITNLQTWVDIIERLESGAMRTRTNGQDTSTESLANFVGMFESGLALVERHLSIVPEVAEGGLPRLKKR